MRARMAAAAVAACAAAASAGAQQLDLSVSPSVIVLQAGDPDVMPVVSSAPVAVTYRVRQNNNRAWLLTVQANGDLDSGASTIDISEVSWSATPAPPFQNGTLSKTIAHTIATGEGNVASLSTGAVTFRMTNSWMHDAGIYTQVLVFTLSTP